MLSKYTVRDIQLKTLEVMEYIDKICRKNGLTYYLAYGTLLGAVRHQGFIPWDDDADIMMDREQYNRFIKVVEEDNDPRFKVADLSTTDDYALPWARVYNALTKGGNDFLERGAKMGVFVDVFPMDPLPENDFKREIVHRKVELMSYLSVSANHKYFSDRERHVTAKKILRPIGRIAGARRWSQRVNEVIMKSADDSSKYFGSMVDYTFSSDKAATLRESFRDTVDLDFEGHKFMCPIDYDGVLTTHYGDYMTPPPEDKRYSYHLFEITDLDDSIPE